MTVASDSPKRIQLSRKKGWRKPEGAVVVARPSKWGNPFRCWPANGTWWFEVPTSGPSIIEADDAGAARQQVVSALRRHLSARRSPPTGWVDVIGYPSDDEIRRELAGSDLACWCPLGQPCHADVLLELANR